MSLHGKALVIASFGVSAVVVAVSSLYAPRGT
jgi:hypothetical protein